MIIVYIIDNEYGRDFSLKKAQFFCYCLCLRRVQRHDRKEHSWRLKSLSMQRIPKSLKRWSPMVDRRYVLIRLSAKKRPFTASSRYSYCHSNFNQVQKCWKSISKGVQSKEHFFCCCKLILVRFATASSPSRVCVSAKLYISANGFSAGSERKALE